MYTQMRKIDKFRIKILKRITGSSPSKKNQVGKYKFVHSEERKDY